MKKTAIPVAPKTNGQITSLRFDITEPLKMTMPDLAINQLSLFVGQNGSGKTFILVNTYALSSIVCMIVANMQRPEIVSGAGVIDLKLIAKHVYDKCFTDQNITGKIGVTYTSGATLDLVFDKGEVILLDHTGLDGLDYGTPVKFMSKNIRTFDAIKLYLKTRKMIIDMKNIAGAPLIEEMLNHYKMYDVTYMEHLLMKMPVMVEQNMKDAFKNFDIHENIVSFGFDNTKDDFYAVVEEKDGKITNKYMTSYGAGHQSVFNMMLGQI